MAKKVTPVVEEPVVEENGHNPVLEASRKFLLAAIGAIALTQDEIEDLIEKLIERVDQAASA